MIELGEYGRSGEDPISDMMIELDSRSGEGPIDDGIRKRPGWLMFLLFTEMVALGIVAIYLLLR